MASSGFDRYRSFFLKEPEKIVSWQDEETGAEGWLVINSLTGNAAGGGTRMRRNAAREEAVFLAKTMEVKFRVCGPQIGGAKSVLRFDPSDPRKPEVLRRWFLHIGGLLKTCYGTAGDQNVNEDEVYRLTSEVIGLKHPQEGVVRGHLSPADEALPPILSRLDAGVVLPTTLFGQSLALAEMITGYGVAESVLAWYEHRGIPIAGQRILVEGFGDVGGAAAYYLHQAGARVVGVICQVSSQPRTLRWWTDSEGLQIPELLARREGPQRSLLPVGQQGQDASSFWETEADVFIPAATSYTIDAARLDQLAASGVRVIACGANTPFDDRELGVCTTQQAADARFAIIPDFIANCGMARLFAYLMKEGAQIEEGPMKADVRQTVREALHPLLHGQSAETGLLERALSRYL
ncbi:MAG TPA: amino acid dehydrogenase [Acidobacteria bacterium]|nr:amino acid dehydrogenase [Acidobacteriota bacterium]